MPNSRAKNPASDAYEDVAVGFSLTTYYGLDPSNRKIRSYELANISQKCSMS